MDDLPLFPSRVGTRASRWYPLTRADRWVSCTCGVSLDRDHNAAINILNRTGRVRVAERRDRCLMRATEAPAFRHGERHSVLPGHMLVAVVWASRRDRDTVWRD